MKGKGVSETRDAMLQNSKQYGKGIGQIKHYFNQFNLEEAGLPSNVKELLSKVNNDNDLNKSDLQAHAVKIGLVPIDDSNSLVTRLKKEFNKQVSQYSARTLPTKKDISKAA